jgi:hypothetical protein
LFIVLLTGELGVPNEGTGKKAALYPPRGLFSMCGFKEVISETPFQTYVSFDLGKCELFLTFFLIFGHPAVYCIPRPRVRSELIQAAVLT